MGSRTTATNPVSSEREDVSEPTQADWSQINATIQRHDGSTTTFEFLRSNVWIEANNLQPGSLLTFSLAELGLQRAAVITAILPSPPIAEGPGHVVTGRIRTSNAMETVRVTFAGGETLQGTPDHPVWSLNQQDWVGLKDLRPGEHVAASNGPALVEQVDLHVTNQPVFNIEVLGEHVYEVTQLGVLVHNTNPLCARIKALNAKGMENLSDAERVEFNRLLRQASAQPRKRFAWGQARVSGLTSPVSLVIL